VQICQRILGPIGPQLCPSSVPATFCNEAFWISRFGPCECTEAIRNVLQVERFNPVAVVDRVDKFPRAIVITNLEHQTIGLNDVSPDMMYPQTTVPFENALVEFWNRVPRESVGSFQNHDGDALIVTHIRLSMMRPKGYSAILAVRIRSCQVLLTRSFSLPGRPTNL